MADPMHQFQVSKVFDTAHPTEFGAFDLSFTNSALAMVVVVALALLVMGAAAVRAAVVPGRMQAVGEIFYDMVAGMVRENVGKEGRPYFPFFMALFLFILFANVLGMFPIFFTVTSHVALNFFIALVIFLAVTVIGLVRHGGHFFSLFLPHGTPWYMAPIIIPIEVISYLSRPMSLSVRLFANMLVGHVLLKVIAGFVISLAAGPLMLQALGVVTFSALLPIVALEFLVAGLQAYIFTILATVYLHDAIHLH
jgi:F-type H+-transporting ATPase subunit a